MEYLIKVLVSSIIIVAVSEVSKHSTLIGSLIASLPLVSLIAIFFIYFETKDLNKIADLSIGIFWLVLPSLLFFLVLPFLLAKQVNFYISMGVAIISTVICYYLMLVVLAKFGIKL